MGLGGKMETIEQHTNYLIRSSSPLSVEKISDVVVSIYSHGYNGEYVGEQTYVKFYIDEYEILDGSTYIQGWIYEDATGLPPIALFVLDKKDCLLGFDNIFHSRADVVNIRKIQIDRVGFEITFDFPINKSEIQLVALLRDGQMVSLYKDEEKPIIEQPKGEEDFKDVFQEEEALPKIETSQTPAFIRFNPNGGFSLKENTAILADTNDSLIHHHIDDAEYKNDSFFLRGWVLNQETQKEPYALLLINEYNKVIHISTTFHSRSDVAKYFEIKENQNFGFKIEFPKLYAQKSLDLYALEKIENGSILTKLCRIW